MRILFLCKDNSVFSQMAEGLLKSELDKSVEVYSVGLKSEKIHPWVKNVLEEINIETSNLRSKTISDLRRTSFDLRITLGEEERQTFEIINEFYLISPDGKATKNSGIHSIWTPFSLYWKLADPRKAEGSERKQLGAFRILREEIDARLNSLIEDGYFDTISKHNNFLDNISNLMEDGLVAHDDKRRIFFFNHEMEKITGISRDKALGMDCHEVFKPDGLCGSQCRFKDAPPDETKPVKYQVPIVDIKGENKILEVSAVPFFIEKNRPSGVIAMIKNVTEIEDLRLKTDKRNDFHGIIAASSKMREIFNSVRSVAASDYPVLILGESGTGKELTASAIHKESRRKSGPFVSINCGALPENILESELFGHVRGAFTGAIKDKKGRFELAHKGTLFLDEVGELTPAFQVKLLRVLQEGIFEKVGGEKSISVDVRIVSATNRNLLQMVENGQFRQDLYYRLCVVPINLPPLKDRKEDIPVLVDEFLSLINKENDKQIDSVSNEAMRLFMEFHWPGNVRQLQNSLQFASIRAEKSVIRAKHLPPEIYKQISEVVDNTNVFADLQANQKPDFMQKSANKITGNMPHNSSSRPLDSPTNAPKITNKSRRWQRNKLEVDLVKNALAETNGNKIEASKILGVGRATLYRFLAKHPEIESK